MSFKVDTFNPTTFNLTLSVLLKYDPKTLAHIESMQDKITQGLHYSTTPNGHSLYKYFAESLHFSIINFATEEATDRGEFERKYIKLIARLSNEIPKFLDFFRSLEFNVGETQHIEGYSEVSMPICLKNNMKKGQLYKTLEPLIKLSEVKDKNKILKFYNDKNFAMNLVRVFRSLGSNEKKSLEVKANQKIKRFDLRISRLSLVISDNYLSNLNPEITHFLL